jgi:hypothetical protein
MSYDKFVTPNRFGRTSPAMDATVVEEARCV